MQAGHRSPLAAKENGIQVPVLTRRPPSIPAQSRWATLWDESIAADATYADARLLERMILNLMAADEALKVAAAEPMVPGSQGQPVENPQFKVAARCDTQARAMAAELRLTPKARTSAASRKPPEEDPFDALDAEDELAEARAKRAS